MEQPVKILLMGICGYGSNYIKEVSEREIPGIKIEGICEVVPNAADLYPIIHEQNIPIYKTPEEFYQEHTADLAVISTPIHLHYGRAYVPADVRFRGKPGPLFRNYEPGQDAV